MEAIKESMAQLSAGFYQKMDNFESEYLKNTNTSSSSSSLASEFVAFKTFIVAALKALQDQIEMIDRAIDSLEMRGRKKILLFHGISESKNEDPVKLVIKTITDHFQLEKFTADNISQCHRMGRMTTPGKSRPILVKFKDLALRSKIWLSKTKLKGTGTTLSEFLTKARHETFMSARDRYGVTKCWSRDGYIYVIDLEGVRHRISCMKELDQLKKELPASSSPIKRPASSKDNITQATGKPRRAAAGVKK